MMRMRLYSLVLIALFLSLSCIVHAEIWVERSDAPCSGGVYEDPGYNFYRYSIGESDISTHIVINEIEQNPYGIDEGNEWVELYNPTISDVNLDGWRLSTTHGKTVTVTLRGTIPANGYVIYTHTEQWLDNIGESVTLRDLSLNEVDRTPYVPDTNGTRYSWQRYPNGKDTDSDSDWEFRASTEGRSNGELPPPPKTIYVDDDFVDDPPNHKWDTIQEGINDANSGDTIIVSDGTYNENVGVYKRLTIRSENGADATIVQVASVDPVFYVRADYVNISGFTVEGATESWNAGIFLYAHHCNISNNNASNNYYGIYLSSSSNNTLMNNSANSNNRYGICLGSSSGNTLTSNTASDNNYGIRLSSSSNNMLTNNNCSNNDIGIDLSSSSNNMLTSNTASDNYYGIWLSSSDDNTLMNNTASYNGRGIYMEHSSNNNTITNNTASYNNGRGIFLYDSSNNTLKDNNASNNSIHGISLYDSSNNLLYHNNLINNNGNAYDSSSDPVCTNFWNSSSEGNYYSDYAGGDNDTDGIGDTPYPIPSDSVDYFPLMQPWNADIPQKGDLNHDGQITAADAVITLQMAVSGGHSDDADMNRDGSVTSLDALMILRQCPGIEIGQI